MNLPDFFTDKDELLNYNFPQLKNLVNTDIDYSTIIENLSPLVKKELLVEQYFKSILLGYNHIFISKLLKSLNNPSANICLPILHKWLGKPRIDNLIIISHPDDAERICKDHVKKAPIFKSFLYDSIISTTDNDDWQSQRSSMNMNRIILMLFHFINPY